jgi:nucleoside 2-deoxyribosyltransferase
MKVYLAARYSRHPEMQQIEASLRAMGHEVTSRWIQGGHELSKEGSTEAQQAERGRFAEEDLADLLAADCCLCFTEEPRSTNSRGGRHVELGIAIGAGKRVVVVGWRENVFCCLPSVEFFETWPSAASALALEALP